MSGLTADLLGAPTLPVATLGAPVVTDGAVTSSATFTLTADKAGSTFRCSLDGGAWTACSAAPAYTGLAFGPHRLQARAVDASGLEGTISERTWTACATCRGLMRDVYDNADFTGRVVRRVDPVIDYAWGTGSPEPLIGPDDFSIRWTGSIVPRYSQTYTFALLDDDGARLYIDGKLVIGDWAPHATRESRGSIALVAGRRHTIKVEYFEHLKTATARLSWSSPSQALEKVPTSQLVPWAG
jgi:hypothetical protein